MAGKGSVRSHEMRVTLEWLNGKLIGWYAVAVEPNGQTCWWADQGNSPSNGFNAERKAIVEELENWTNTVHAGERDGW